MSGKPELAGQTVVVIGGSSGIGLETARLARGEGAHVILTARDPDRLHRVGLELGVEKARRDVEAHLLLYGAWSARPTSPRWPCTS